ncbi:tRNA-splicing ligase RtcB [Keratinibaculum paraultunense]|uniref:3'-phosphate/5'-hydroxy nucleic acid ligase n=1 Tax=Keratinibaculum paraultunense TaxID=1278232 RepID=A0A4R3KS28_9FIRM|nr:RtcB family protein [Keratinibaculum paraultunense]QQY79732.1 RtcB family protein [Keratinibaculum paraultunense]TCS86959.1 tRNA-splicing ligase RtcB [Keratinibaculum paraultunense]
MKIYNLGRIPIKSWATDLDEETLQQAENLSNLSFAYSHIALMADAHVGFGMPIGGVLASSGVIIPNAVGVDIGCGIIAVKTDIKEIDIKSIKKIVDKAHKVIPLGFNNHKKPRKWEGFNNQPNSKIVMEELDAARYQLGTLGGGNHFLSIEKGSDGHIWLMVHSGSRNFGYKIAEYYNNLAINLNEKIKLVPPKQDLAGLYIDSKEGKEYFNAMSYALKFAAENRRQLLEQFYSIFRKETKSEKILKKVSIHHNYASIEEHFGKEVIVHRKGAIRAEKGELGIIPGSMGTPSYIVEGLGNPESFRSCSHGAGRVMSRRQANKTITKEMADKSMGDIVHKGWEKDFSEAPMAYKDIEEVMDNQKDLVKRVIKLTPLGVVKG